MDPGCVLVHSGRREHRSVHNSTSPRPALQRLAGQTHVPGLLEGLTPCIPINHRSVEWFLLEGSLKPISFHLQAGTLPLGCPEASSTPALGLSQVPGSSGTFQA